MGMNREENLLTIDECKEIQLSIMEYIDKVCEENGLRYYLCGGTLIGAVRHRGYIPWDDDIDIMLPREDYRKLIELLKDNKKYKCLSMYTKEDYFYPFAKVVDTDTSMIEHNADLQIEGYGVYVDLFPVDGLPTDPAKNHRYYRKVMRLRNLYYLAISDRPWKPKNPLKRLALYAAFLYAKARGWKPLLKKLDRLSQRYDFATSEIVGVPCAGYGERETYHKALYDKTLRVPFEEYQFNIPAGYDEYLRCLYGDYMQIPPKEKQVTRHDFSAYRK